MTNKLLLIAMFICSLQICVQAETRKPWNQLDEKSKNAWLLGVSPLLNAGFENPGDDYKYYLSLDSELGNEIQTTHSVSDLRKFLELEISRYLWLSNLENESNKPSDNEVVGWLEKRADAYGTTDTVDLLSIYIRKFDKETTASALSRANAALKNLKNGKSFKDVALEYSDARSAALGGSVGTVYRGSISPQLEKIAFSAEVDKVIGPIESSNGFYILKIVKRHKPFLLTNTSDRKRIVHDILMAKNINALEKHSEQWKSSQSIVIESQPSDVQNWANQPWIKVKNGKVLNYSHLNFILNSLSLNDEESASWSNYYAEEAAINEPVAITTLATYDVTSNSAMLKTATELAIPIYGTVSKLRKWYKELSVNDETLKKFLSDNSDMFPTTRKYTFIMWNRNLDSLGTETNNVELTTSYTYHLNNVYQLSQQEKINSTEDALKFFVNLKSKFPETKMTSFTQVSSISPFIDPILIRTQKNKLSRPFDTGHGVGLIFMIDSELVKPEFQSIRPALLDAWKKVKLDSFLAKVRRKAGVEFR